MGQDQIYKYEPLWGSWYIDSLIGEGSFGSVYKVYREELGRKYFAAVKIISVPSKEQYREAQHTLGRDESTLKMYFQDLVKSVVDEIGVLYSLSGNSNIINYQDHKVIERDDSLGWDILIRMEYVTSLRDYLDNHSMTREDIIRLGIDMCSALEICQRQNIIHRDIKDENIFVNEYGVHKLGDFGIARELSKTGRAASMRGTPLYMAPEIYRGEKYDSTVDIYSLGIVLYKLLNHDRLPFLPQYPELIRFRDSEHALERRLNGDPFPVPDQAGNVLGQVILKACSFTPSDRYTTATDFKRDLETSLFNFSSDERDELITQNYENIIESVVSKIENETTLAEQGKKVYDKTESINKYSEGREIAESRKQNDNSDILLFDTKTKKNQQRSKSIAKAIAISVTIIAFIVTGILLIPNLFSTYGTTSKAIVSSDNSSENQNTADGKQVTTQMIPMSDKTIIVGGLAPLSGEIAVYGIAAMNGAQLAFDEINEAGGVNGIPLEFIVYDDQGVINEATNAYHKLINNDGAIAILGSITSKPSIAVAQLAAKANIPMVTPTATALDVTKMGANVFRACYIDPFQGEIMAKFAKENLSATKVAVIYNSSDEYSSGLKDSFAAKAVELGLDIVASESYTTGETDFKAQLTKIAASDAQTLFVPDYYNTVALIANQAKTTGLTIPLIGVDGWDGILGFANPEDVDGFFFTTHYSTEDKDPKLQDFLKNYYAKYYEEPNALSALGYDAAYILFEAIKATGSTNSTKIIDALNLTDYFGVTGHIQFDVNRNPRKTTTIIQIKNGQYKYFGKVDP